MSSDLTAPAQTGGLTHETFAAWLNVLSSAFPPRTDDGTASTAALAAYWLVLKDKPWLTGAILEGAVEWLLGQPLDFLPPPGRVLEACRHVWEERELDAAREAAAHPVPDDPDARALHERRMWFLRASREQVLEVFRREFVAGKARAHKRAALIESYRARQGIPSWCGVPEDVWRGQDEPTEAECAAVEVMLPEDVAAWPGVPADIARLYDSLRPGEGRRQRVEWADGTVTEPTVHKLPEMTPEERREALAEWDRKEAARKRAEEQRREH